MANDPQKYSEEWFNMAKIPIAKEFELPNVSNTMNHHWINTINMPIPEISLEYPIIETELNLSCNTEIHMAAIPIIGSAVKMENHEVFAPNPPPLQTPKGEIFLSGTSRSHGYVGINGLTTMLNRQPCVPCNISLNVSPAGINLFPRTNQQSNLHTFLNSYHQFCPNRSKAHMTYQPAHFQGITKTLFPCLGLGLMTNQENPNSSTHRVNQPTYVSIMEKQETLVPGLVNSQILEPKQEPQVLPEINSSQVGSVLGSKPQKPKKNKGKNPITKKTNANQTDPPVEHKCFQCQKVFLSGNALGGHMSCHARKRKREAMKNIDKPFGPENSFFDFIDSLGFENRSSSCYKQVLNGTTSRHA
ncbi:protein TsetseEP-like [Fagus crenata]